MLIIYESHTEQFIMTSDKETKFLNSFFAKDSGRDLEDFDRSFLDDVISITTRPILSRCYI